MEVTGKTSLVLPRVGSYYFEMKNVILDTYSPASITFSTTLQNHNLSFTSGRVYGMNTGYIASYNTGKPFSISGWFFDNGSDKSYYGFVNGVSFRTNNVTSAKASGITINNDLSFDYLKVASSSIQYTLTFPSAFTVGSALTGQLTADTAGWIFGNSLAFYNSFESLLSGQSSASFVNTGTGITLVFYDNDDSAQNNLINFGLSLDTISGKFTKNFSVPRTGLYNNTITQFNSLSTSNIISGLFDGTWSGRQFVYEDVPQSITLNYNVSTTDSLAQGQSEAIQFSYTPVSPANGQTYQSEYVTGFTLTSSGQYTKLPSVIFTGYYYATGLQQALISLLFSSGCTGYLPVTFTPANGLGKGASGTLITKSVLFKDIYSSGTASYYTIDSYSVISGGTGYTMPPKAVVNTGLYGSKCFDVPKASGFTVAWFSSFDTSGALAPRASYLTGEVLVQTGMVSGGLLTGFFVTGINITNIGSGYNSVYRPLLSFIRDPSDTLTGNASGTLSTKSTGLYTFSNIWKVETGIAGTDLIWASGNSGTMYFDANQNYFSVRITSSGLDNTEPVVAKLSYSTTNGTTLFDYVTGRKYYSTDSGFLKKKSSDITGVFNVGNDLSFLVSQTELDEFYSADGYTNNTWTIDIGDLDF